MSDLNGDDSGFRDNFYWKFTIQGLSRKVRLNNAILGTYCWVLSCRRRNMWCKYCGRFCGFFSSAHPACEDNAATLIYTKQCILTDLDQGIVPQRVHLADSLPFVLQKGEVIVWVANHVEARKQKTTRQYVRKSFGVSNRLFKGFTVHSGRGTTTPIEHTELAPIGRGTLILTSKNIYWICSMQSIKIPFNKIVSFIAYSDALLVQKEGVSATPHVFMTGDATFLRDVIGKLTQI